MDCTIYSRNESGGGGLNIIAPRIGGKKIIVYLFFSDETERVKVLNTIRVRSFV